MRSPRSRDTALTRDAAITIAENGLPTTFVPGRNLVFLTFAAALAYRRDAKHLVAGMCETDYSGYPDCRDDTLKAMQLALNLGMERRFVVHTPLMWIDKAATFALAHELGGQALRSICFSNTPTPAIWATARTAMPGAMAAANARPAGCARTAMPDGSHHDDRQRRDASAPPPRGIAVPRFVRTYHSCGELPDSACRHGLRAARAVPHSGAARPRRRRPAC